MKLGRKTWSDGVKMDVKSFSLFREVAQDQNWWKKKAKGDWQFLT